MKALLALGVVAVLVAYFGSPLLTVRSLVAAAKAGDEAALERLVDFPAFRDSAKAELTDTLMDRMQDDPRAGALGGLGMLLGPMIVDGAVDALVNARTISQMVQTAKAPNPADRTADAKPDDGKDDIRQSYGYRDLNTFVLTLTDPDRPNQSLKLLLKRHGLFGWKLSGLELPDA